MNLSIGMIAVIFALSGGLTLASAQYRPEDNPTKDPRKTQEIQVPSTNIKPDGQSVQSLQGLPDRGNGTTGRNPTQGQDRQRSDQPRER